MPPTTMFDLFEPGTMLGRYELVATIGEGGMARVVLARQRGPAGFEKVVVVKLIHPSMAADQAAVGMLLDEARIAAQINHPHVVQTYELGEAHGSFYIVMEYLAGESLQRVLKQATMGGALDPRMAARIVAGAADGLHAAHELCDLRGQPLSLVHRDVSLGNIIVLYNGNVKVVDFGIAKSQDRVSTETQQGQLKGKYSYMSPEQIRNEPLDRRSDVFALGVVLWECLALRRLFNEPNVPSTLMQILNGERIPPSRYRPEVPAALDAIALKALAIDPRDRFASAAEMKRALEDAIYESRCDASDVQMYMTAVFGDRMRKRQALLATCNSERPTVELDIRDLGFDDTSGIRSPVMTEAMTSAPRVLEGASRNPRGRERNPDEVGASHSERDHSEAASHHAHSRYEAPNRHEAASHHARSRYEAAEAASHHARSQYERSRHAPSEAASHYVRNQYEAASRHAPSEAASHHARDQYEVASRHAPSEAASHERSQYEAASRHAPPPQWLPPSYELPSGQLIVPPLVSTPRPSTQEMPRRRPWLGVLIALAGILVGVGLTFQVLDRDEQQPPIATTAPVITGSAGVSRADDVKPSVKAPVPVIEDIDDGVVRSKLRPEHLEPMRVTTEEPPRGTSVRIPSGPSAKELYKRGTELYLGGNIVDAEAAYKQALVVDRGYAAAHRGLGFIYQRMGFDEKAIESLRRYLKLAPNASDAGVIRDRIEQMGGQP